MRLCRVFCHPRTANVKPGILRVHRRGAEDAEIGGPRDLIRKAESRKGISEIEGKAARVAASESGDERVSIALSLSSFSFFLIQKSESAKILRVKKAALSRRTPKRLALAVQSVVELTHGWTQSSK